MCSNKGGGAQEDLGAVSLPCIVFVSTIGGLTHLKKMNKFLLFFGFVTLSIYLLSMENKNKNRKVIIRITESQLAKIVEETKRLKMNKSTLLREIIDSHIDQISSESIMEKYRVKKSKN